MTGITLLVGLRKRPKTIGKRTLRTNSRIICFMLRAVVSRECPTPPFQGFVWKYSGDYLPGGELPFGGALIDYRRFKGRRKFNGRSRRSTTLHRLLQGPARSRHVQVALDLGDFVETALMAAAYRQW